MSIRARDAIIKMSYIYSRNTYLRMGDAFMTERDILSNLVFIHTFVLVNHSVELASGCKHS